MIMKSVFLQNYSRERPVHTPANASVNRGALTTRYFDFWLLGGASLLAWLVLFVCSSHRNHWAIDVQFRNLAAATTTLAVFINNPHFLVSYKLAYLREPQFLVKNWWQLIVVPLCLMGVFALTYVNFRAPVSVVPGLTSLTILLKSWGANPQILVGPRLGDLIFTVLFNAMYFSVGWHYTKQAFGCMTVYAHFDGYQLTHFQRGLLRWNLLGIWWLNFTYNNLDGRQQTFSRFTYYSMDLPDILLPITAGILTVGCAAVFSQVFYANYRKNKQLPTLNFLVPFVAMYVWWMPFTRETHFYLYLTPLFHSLQYLAFVYKVEDTRLKQGAHYEIKATAIVLGVIVTAWLCFDFIPNSLDTYLHTFQHWRMFFFYTAAMLFINIHHYFIDNVLWRSHDTHIKKYLLT
jgi:hypothetical protein